MDFDSAYFFIDLMDFFFVLLPGSLLSYLLMGEMGQVVLKIATLRSPVRDDWAAFLFASYFFGHLVFPLGSWLDEFYDWSRRHTLNAQITWLARYGHLIPWPARVLIWLMFKAEGNLAVERAAKIKQQALGACWVGSLSPAQVNRK